MAFVATKKSNNKFYQILITDYQNHLKFLLIKFDAMKWLCAAFLIISVSIFSFAHAQQKNNLAKPELTSGKFRITINNAFIEIDPASGARVTSLNLNGINFLTGPEINPKYWGSSFWDLFPDR